LLRFVSQFDHVKSSLVSRFSFAIQKGGDRRGPCARLEIAFRKFLFALTSFPTFKSAFIPFYYLLAPFLLCFAKSPDTISKKLKSGLRHSMDTAVSSTRKLTKFGSLLDLLTKWSTSLQLQWNTTTGALLLSDVPHLFFGRH